MSWQEMVLPQVPCSCPGYGTALLCLYWSDQLFVPVLQWERTTQWYFQCKNICIFGYLNTFKKIVSLFFFKVASKASTSLHTHTLQFSIPVLVSTILDMPKIRVQIMLQHGGGPPLLELLRKAPGGPGTFIFIGGGSTPPKPLRILNPALKMALAISSDKCVLLITCNDLGQFATYRKDPLPPPLPSKRRKNYVYHHLLYSRFHLLFVYHCLEGSIIGLEAC